MNKSILAAFIMRLVKHLEKTKLNSKTTMYCSPDYSKFFETPCIALYLLMKYLRVCCSFVDVPRVILEDNVKLKKVQSVLELLLVVQ